MKLLIHFTLLVVFVRTSDPTLYNSLRENVRNLFEAPGADTSTSASTKEPTFKNVRLDHVGRDSLRNGDTGHAIVSHDSDAAPKLKVINRKRKKIRQDSDTSPVVNDDNAQMVKLASPYKNEMEEKILKNMKDIEKAHNKTNMLQNIVKDESYLNHVVISPFSKAGNFRKKRHVMDMVPNVLRSHKIRRRHFRRYEENSNTGEGLDANWKEEWTAFWASKKMEALNSSVGPSGDTVNMVAARPWGVHCGDPNQHDMPWGTCTLAAECEPELRVYRGDFFCGKTEFVCCALFHTNYNLYDGIDFSFEDKGLSTDSEEKKRYGQDVAHGKRKKERAKLDRKKTRLKRKIEIKKTIRKVVNEIKKMLNKQYKNGTRERQRRTKLLKKFVKHLKKQYKKDRKAVQEIHEEEMLKVDADIMDKLRQLRVVTDEFMRNETFRSIIINGTISKEGARMLISAYPEVARYIHPIRLRRNMPMEETNLRDKSTNDDEFDVEYGYLYY